MKKYWKNLFLLVIVCLFSFTLGVTAKAAVVDISLTNGVNESQELYIGDTGTILPVTEGLTDWSGQPVEVMRWEYANYNAEVLTVDAEGHYQAVGTGYASVYVQGYDALGNCVFNASCSFIVSIDMSQVTMVETSVKGYKAAFEPWEGYLTLKSPVALSSDNSSVQCVSSNGEMNVSCYFDGENKLSLYTYNAGKTTLTITINGKAFTVNLTVAEVSISKRGYVGIKGKSYTLKIKGTKDKVTWKSSNSKVAKVSTKGKVKFKKKGNAVITASIGDIKVGCAVSVVTKKRKKVINRAIKIGTTWKYSQPKRMQKGFYDCSSLVWKSYILEKRYLGSKNYAPVAANIALWCKQKGKVLTKSYNRNHIQKMKFQPGDLAFQTGADNGRYKGIYHVEMIVGYAVSYYDEKGKPVLNELWAARPEGYYGGGLLVSRPSKK